MVSCVEQLQPCPCWGQERRGCSCPGAHPATVLGPGAGSSAGSTQCLCVCTGTVVTEMVPPRLLFPEDEVTGLQCLSSLEAESVPALPRLRAQPPLHSSPSWSVPQGRGLQALKQNGVRPPAPHGLTARGPLASALPPSARQHQLRPKQLRAPSVGMSLPGPWLWPLPHSSSTGWLNPPQGWDNKYTSQRKRGSESSPAAPPCSNPAGPGAAASSCAV